MGSPGASTRRPASPLEPGHRTVTVLHLDHTVEPGGAELALLRILDRPPPWNAALLLPDSDATSGLGVFAPLADAAHVTVELAGPEQRAGGSRTHAGAVLRTTVSIARAAVAVRTSRAFRTADVVHANTSRTAVIGALACLRTSKRLIIHLRDHVTEEALGRFGVASLSRALSRARGVIANSHSTLSSAEPYLAVSTERAVIESASGLDTTSARETSASLRPLRDGVRRVVIVGRIDPWKGQDILLDAFAHVFGASSTRLVLAGSAAFGHEGYLKRLRSRATALGIAGQVDMPGHVPDIGTLLRDADICVHASVRPEPLGQSVLQYLAAGRPTIATRAGGPAEWIEDGVNGLLVPMRDPDALARALERLRDDPDLRNHLAANAVATPGLRTDADIVTAHHRFFLRCADGHRPAPVHPTERR